MTRDQELGGRIVRAIALGFLVLNLACLALSLVWLLPDRADLVPRALVGFLFTTAFYYCLYLGHRWPRWALLFLVVLNLSAVVWLVQSGRPLNAVDLVGMLLPAAVVAVLFGSRKVRSYYRFERQLQKEPVSLFRGPGA